jgi:hypothetical protein
MWAHRERSSEKGEVVDFLEERGALQANGNSLSQVIETRGILLQEVDGENDKRSLNETINKEREEVLMEDEVLEWKYSDDDDVDLF